jgi:hypothetical protein
MTLQDIPVRFFVLILVRITTTVIVKDYKLITKIILSDEDK